GSGVRYSMMCPPRERSTLAGLMCPGSMPMRSARALRSRSTRITSALHRYRRLGEVLVREPELGQELPLTPLAHAFLAEDGAELFEVVVHERLDDVELGAPEAAAVEDVLLERLVRHGRHRLGGLGHRLAVDADLVLGVRI